MKNLWRIAILFMLSGMIGGGGTAMAFFRLADADVPMLNTVSLAAILWCAVYCLGMFALRKVRNLTWLYYTGTMMIALAFTCGLGIVRLLGGSGWLEGVAGVIISAAAASVWQHCFCSGSFRWPDRLSWLAGVIAALLAIFYLFSRNRMAWLETLFFYLGEMLLVFWAMASPLTLYGKALKRWSFRLGLLGVGAMAVWFSPVFVFQPWNSAPESMPDGKWQRTFVTPQGSRFVWIDPHDRSGLYTPSGRLLMPDNADEEWLPALPVLLGVMNRADPAIKVAAPVKSILPDAFRKMADCQVNWIKHPESLQGTYGAWYWKNWSALQRMPQSSPQKYDLLLISALNDNQYPGALQRNWDFLSHDLAEDAVVAVPWHVLCNKTMFVLLHEKFNCNYSLPIGNGIWIFSNRKLDMSAKTIDEKLLNFYGHESTLLRHALGLLSHWNSELKLSGVEIVQYGSNRWLGSWWWLLMGVGLLLLWRGGRLLAERRNAMHNYWYCVENGFSAMGMFLLALELLCVDLGVFALALAVLPVLGFGGWCRVKTGGIRLTLLINCLLPLSALLGGLWNWLAVIVMLQNSFFAHQQLQMLAGNTASQRKLHCFNAVGMLLAVAALAVFWHWQMPLLLVWVIFVALRIPHLWK